MPDFFAQKNIDVISNNKLREPQKNAYNAIREFFNENHNEREAGIVLPVGCGKSGCIAITPFAVKSKRTLVIAPNLHIAKQLNEEFDPTHGRFFYKKCAILNNGEFPEPVEIRGNTVNTADLSEADIVITNIQQLQGDNNKWLNKLPGDFFDLIIFDEGHHTVADSWTRLKNKFINAKVVNFSATPLRADGKMMAGKIVYSYPIFKAIKNGYVKHLTGIILKPQTLRYVRNIDGLEIDVSLEEVIKLGEEDSDFRRSIVTSKETLDTIVDASIRALNRLRDEAQNKQLKIVASALNMEHCIQIVEAYRARNFKADYVHSNLDSKTNERIMSKLEHHDLDVIVQVRKLGEGFDHPYLAVAAVFSIFNNLSPFIQFVGRVMRVIVQNDPKSPLNHGIVVFHAGANIAKRWEDFQEYSEADQSYFDQLLPLISDNEFGNESEIIREPNHLIEPVTITSEYREIKSPSPISLEEKPLIDDSFQQTLKKLCDAGYTSAIELMKDLKLDPVPVTKAKKRQAQRSSLDESVKLKVGQLLSKHRINHEGHELDHKRLGRSNFVILKSNIDKKINTLLNQKPNQRNELTAEQLDLAINSLSNICSEVEKELIENGKN